MLQLVHTDALDFSTPVSSYWEESAAPLEVPFATLNSSVTCDVMVIGGGFTGLNAAIELAGAGVDVRVIEAGHIGWGASGRNGGFACIGSHKLGYGKMIARYGLDATRAFYRAMQDSIALVNGNLEHFKIDAWKHGVGEVTLAHLPSRADELRKEQSFLSSTFGDATEYLSREGLEAIGMKGPHFHAGLRGRHGFGVHPLNYARGLARAAHQMGIPIHTHSEMTAWRQENGVHVISTARGEVRARRVLVATNGYTPEKISRLHAGRILPAMSSIIVTRPLSQDEQSAQGWTSSTMAYDSRNLLHYFRLLPNGRFLFGGRGGTNSAAAMSEPYRQYLTAAFHALFPAWAKVDITHFWRGFACLAYDSVPYVGALDENRTVWTALAYHGNGVAMGSWCGRAVARMMTNRPHDAPAVITRRLARFPLPIFRPIYLKGAYVWYGWKDAR